MVWVGIPDTWAPFGMQARVLLVGGRDTEEFQAKSRRILLGMLEHIYLKPVNPTP